MNVIESKLSQAQIFKGNSPQKFPRPKVQNGEFPPKIMKIEKKCLFLLKMQFNVSRSTQTSKLDLEQAQITLWYNLK